MPVVYQKFRKGYNYGDDMQSQAKKLMAMISKKETDKAGSLENRMKKFDADMKTKMKK